MLEGDEIKNPRMRIVNKTGISRDTQVIAAGEDVTAKLGIVAISMHLQADDPVKAAIEVYTDHVEVEPHGVRWLAHHPISDKLQELASMTFRDGTVATFHADGHVDIKPPPTADEIATAQWNFYSSRLAQEGYDARTCTCEGCMTERAKMQHIWSRPHPPGSAG